MSAKVLELTKIQPQEKDGKRFVTVMGRTAAVLVLIGKDGQIEELPANEYPEYDAGDKLELNDLNEIQQTVTPPTPPRATATTRNSGSMFASKCEKNV